MMPSSVIKYYPVTLKTFLTALLLYFVYLRLIILSSRNKQVYPVAERDIRQAS